MSPQPPAVGAGAGRRSTAGQLAQQRVGDGLRTTPDHEEERFAHQPLGRVPLDEAGALRGGQRRLPGPEREVGGGLLLIVKTL